MNSRMVVIVLLACVWIYLAYGAWQRGSVVGAVLFLAVGVALTYWRLTRARA